MDMMMRLSMKITASLFVSGIDEDRNKPVPFHKQCHSSSKTLQNLVPLYKLSVLSFVVHQHHRVHIFHIIA